MPLWMPLESNSGAHDCCGVHCLLIAQAHCHTAKSVEPASGPGLTRAEETSRSISKSVAALNKAWQAQTEARELREEETKVRE